ncbi:sigma-70 family RNA polymerase sigma factor [Ornithinibacillus sp. 179-J 7C1 HS]|uniref:sigma-70 family RNA polymerase sigma factor n=1 Tax=Ornithinibacillus sp. 179-J 7C1 HS TaxID=3142384 RepID=UPI0039A2BB2B
MSRKSTENWTDKLILEYEQSKQALFNMKNNLGDSLLDQLDKTQINSMIETIQEAIEWMSTGREPNKIRGIDKKAAYQRMAIEDMDMFPSLEIIPEERKLNQVEKSTIINILAEMTPRQRQCFLLHTVYALSYAEISNELNIGRSTVQKHIERAKDKICRADVV